MLIDTSYFIGEINIPQLSQPAVTEMVEALISRWEPYFLRSVLGQALYDAFTIGIAAEVPDQKWVDLRDGKEYSDACGKLHYLTGLANSTSKVSPIASYVFFRFLEAQTVQLTGVGAAAPKTKNATRISPAPLMVSAWNNMADGVRSLRHFLDTNKDTYNVYKAYVPDSSIRPDAFYTMTEDTTEVDDEGLDGYEYDLERRGLGTMDPGTEWDYVDGGGFKLLIAGDVFKEGETVILHFKPHVTVIEAQSSTYPEWDGRMVKEFTEKINVFGI